MLALVDCNSFYVSCERVDPRLLGRPVTILQDMEESISMHAAHAAKKLREQNLAAGVLRVFLMTSRFRTEQKQ